MEDNYKLFTVKVVVEWTVEVEALTPEDAEVEAADRIQGAYSWALSPTFESYWAEEVGI